MICSSTVRLKCRSQVTDQVRGYRSRVTGQVTGHRSQDTQKTIGHYTKNKISQGTLMIFLSFKQLNSTRGIIFSCTTRAMHVKIMWKGCEKCVKKWNHVKSMLAKIQVHHISISHACELFDMRVKFCNTCEKFLSYVWTFFPCILLHVKSFHTCETILSCMWTSNFTCIIDAMHVKFFTCMWTLLGM